MKKIILMLIFVILVSGTYADSITISSVSTNPNEVQPGGRSSVDVRLRNQGNRDIEDISVGLDLSSSTLPFIPIGSAAKKIVEEIEEDESSTVTFNLMTSPDAKPDTYKIPIVVTYKDADDLTVEETSVIGLIVEAVPELEVAIEESEVFKVGQLGGVTIRFVNKGLGDIKFLSAKLQKAAAYDVISSNDVYIGNVEPDDFETETFRLRFKQKIGNLPLEVKYKDNKNREFKQTFNLDLSLFSQEEAFELGLESKPKTQVYVGVFVAIVLFFLIRRWRKKRRLKRG
jgi:hypothetical protein